MPDFAPIPTEALYERARRGLGKVDHYGKRGIVQVSAAEIEAMACLLAAMGLAPIPPGTRPEDVVPQLPARQEGAIHV